MPVRGLLALMVKNIFFLVSQPDIKDVKQLKGKRIGVTALAAGSSKIAEDALKNLGIDPGKDVIFVALGPDIRLAALKARSVDAAGMWPPTISWPSGKDFITLCGRGRYEFTLCQRSDCNDQKNQGAARPGSPHAASNSTEHGPRSRAQTGASAILMAEFKGWDQETLDRSLNFVIKGMSVDGIIGEFTIARSRKWGANPAWYQKRYSADPGGRL